MQQGFYGIGRFFAHAVRAYRMQIVLHARRHAYHQRFGSGFARIHIKKGIRIRMER